MTGNCPHCGAWRGSGTSCPSCGGAYDPPAVSAPPAQVHQSVSVELGGATRLLIALILAGIAVALIWLVYSSIQSGIDRI